MPVISSSTAFLRAFFLTSGSSSSISLLTAISFASSATILSDSAFSSFFDFSICSSIGIVSLSGLSPNISLVTEALSVRFWSSLSFLFSMASSSSIVVGNNCICFSSLSWSNTSCSPSSTFFLSSLTREEGSDSTSISASGFLFAVIGSATPLITPPTRPPAIPASMYSSMASSLSMDKPACALSIIC